MGEMGMLPLLYFCVSGISEAQLYREMLGDKVGSPKCIVIELEGLGSEAIILMLYGYVIQRMIITTQREHLFHYLIANNI